MSSGPRAIAVMIVVGAALWTLHVTSVTDEPFALDAAVLIGIGLLMFSLISAIGLLIPRGRWARNLARGLLAVETSLALFSPLRGWGIAALLATALAIVGVQGRWLDGWLRGLPAADGPGLKTMLFILGCLALIPAVGFAAPGGVQIRLGILGAAGLVIGWGYSKAKIWALWAGRLLLVPLALLAAPAAPLAGAVLLIVLASALAWLAWSAEARLAISPLLDHLPGPRHLQPRSEAAE